MLISDLHLQAGRPDITRQFFEFLAGPARRARRLLILGDLFETWVGDDAVGPFEREVADRLAATAALGVEIIFIAGNRDFLLGDEYCRLAGMRRAEEPLHLDLGGEPVLLLHGDVLCTDDTAYQRFRARVRDPGWQRRMLARPRWQRLGLARLLRLASRLRTRSAPERIMDVNPDEVRATLQREQVGCMIHGHTHRPAVHADRIDDRPVRRFVLGDWFDQGSVIEADDSHIRLITLPRGSAEDARS
nr:UDP-2,3-diacylglucosamine diphosphatase [Wenzhouxiangella sp. XN79A]